MTSNDPSTVQLDDVKAALRGLGIETECAERVVSVKIEYGRITVVRERVNDEGRTFAAGLDKKANVTTEIGVVS